MFVLFYPPGTYVFTWLRDYALPRPAFDIQNKAESANVKERLKGGIRKSHEVCHSDLGRALVRP